MCAIYSWRKLHQINKELLADQLLRFSLKHILSTGKKQMIQVQESEGKLFANYNEPLGKDAGS